VTTATATQSGTTIISNGWPSGRHSICDLIHLLETQQLEVSRNAICHEGFGRFRFHGNFERQSHVFNVRSSEPGIVRALYASMMRNRLRADYLQDAAFRDNCAAEHHALLKAGPNKAAYDREIALWGGFRPIHAGEIAGEPVAPALMAKLIESTKDGIMEQQVVSFRAECSADVERLIASLGAEAANFTVVAKETDGQFPDCEVEAMLGGELTAQRLHGYMVACVDGHVMAETLRAVRASENSMERRYSDEWPGGIG